MPRHAPPIAVPPEDKLTLFNRAKSRILPKHMVDRAKMILASEAGTLVKQIAQALHTYPNKVIYWRQRYVEHGLVGLQDTPRSGRPPKYGARFRTDLLQVLRKPPPKGLARWDGPTVAEKLGAPVDAVWTVLRKEGINLQRQRSWCIRTDTHFASKAADIVGLYLAPPSNAIMLCVDETPSIQALERKTGYINTESGKVIRAYQSTAKRHGTLNLFAALAVTTGKIQGKVTQEKKRTEFQAFMDDIVNEYSSDQEIHVVLDHNGTHKKNDEWLTQKPNVRFHCTPTSASWLNQIEIWFGIFSRKALRGASFASPQQLRARIEDFIARYNPTSQPFKWRKREVKGALLKDNIGNLTI